MRFRKNILLVSLVGLIGVTGQVSGQVTEMRQKLYQSYITADMKSWAEVLDEMEVMYSKSHSSQILYELTFAQYGYIAFCMVRDDKESARFYSKKAGENIKVLVEKSPDEAALRALNGALYGLKAGIDPYKVMIYARKSIHENELALQLDEGVANVWMEKGNLDFHKPDIFGKDVPGAIDSYTRAVQLFESSNQTAGNWMYLNTLVSLARAYTLQEEYRKADDVYKKILAAEPGITWRRDRDYPRFRKKYLQSA